MTKRNCIVLGLHVVAITGIIAGYVCLYKKLNQKKPKLINSLDLD